MLKLFFAKSSGIAGIAGDAAAIACIAQKSLKICERCRLATYLARVRNRPSTDVSIVI